MSINYKYFGLPDVQLWNDEFFTCLWWGDWGEHWVNVYRFGRADPIAEFEQWIVPDPLDGNRVHDGSGRVFDARSWQEVRPPANRRYHPDLARFTLDGRYVSLDAGTTIFSSNPILFDTRTDKYFPRSRETVFSSMPGLGLVSAELKYGEASARIRLIPSALSDIPPKLLELWAQVAVRGELGEDGRFVPWDEPTWDKKRQELAAIPAPRPDLPFPGYVATDKLHWLRAEYSTDKADKDRLSQELLRRAELNGDLAEAVRWRAERAKYERELAPPPREAMP